MHCLEFVICTTLECRRNLKEVDQGFEWLDCVSESSSSDCHAMNRLLSCAYLSTAPGVQVPCPRLLSARRDRVIPVAFSMHHQGTGRTR